MGLLSGVALSDIETIVTLGRSNGVGEILEISLDGAVVSRRRVSGKLERVIGRHHGTDYVLALAPKTYLDRVTSMTPPVRQSSVDVRASFSIAPNDGTLAWIELGDRFRPRGPLRLSTLQDLARSDPPLLNNAVSVGRSPDGRSLAALIDEDDGDAMKIVDRSGRITPVAARVYRPHGETGVAG